MPFTKLVFKPGVNRETTSYGNENGWYDSNLIRFREGRPEKMGGWSQLGANSFLGVARSLHVWTTLNLNKLMGAGTSSKFYIEEGNTYNDITPIRTTATLSANPFTTGSSSSGIVTVTHTAHGAITGDFVTFSGATATDGITAAQLNNEFELTVVNANSYTVATAGSASSGSTAGGGSSVIAAYQISVGLNIEVSGTGFGAGQFGGTVSGAATTTLSGTLAAAATSVPLTSASSFETAATTISANVAVTDTTIPVASVSGFPDVGTILIGSEKIRYGSITGTTLADLSRGSDGTTAATHSSSAAVTFVGLILIEDELIQYTGKTTNTLDAGVVRGVRGTTDVGHSSGATVTEANDFVGFGGASVINTSTSNLRLWGQDNWGEDLVFNVKDSTPYYWDADLSVTTRATALASQTGASDAPTAMRTLLVSGADRHLIAFGCNALGETSRDPLLVRWSDQESPFDWTPTATNTAGSLRLSSGSEIISMQKTRQEILIWTDASLHSMRFTGPPFTFGISLLSNNISTISLNTTISVGDRTFFMDKENFYAYTGQLQIIPCTLLRYVFDDINLDQSDKFFAASNRMFDEVFFFFVSSEETEVDRYVKFNYTEGTWDLGSLPRTAWVDFGIHSKPRATGIEDSANVVFSHENGENANGSAMDSYIESSDFDLDPDGNSFMFISRIIPDLSITDTSEDSSGKVNFILKTRNYPGDTLATNSTNEVTPTTQQSFLRSRSRQAALKIQSSVTDIAWTMGETRMELRADGRR
jgi:hypothetical protein